MSQSQRKTRARLINHISNYEYIIPISYLLPSSSPLLPPRPSALLPLELWGSARRSLERLLGPCDFAVYPRANCKCQSGRAVLPCAATVCVLVDQLHRQSQLSHRIAWQGMAWRLKSLPDCANCRARRGTHDCLTQRNGETERERLAAASWQRTKTLAEQTLM